MEGKPFALIGVNSDETPEIALEAVKANELNWRSFQNSQEGKADIATDWKVSGWPTIIIIDGKGIIRYRGHDGHEATKVATKYVALLDPSVLEEEEVIEEVIEEEEIVEEPIIIEEEIVEEPIIIDEEPRS
jgi:hypothetical protein